jgi:hypothetical protein
MKTITVRANGNLWENLTQVEEQLANTCTSDWVCFDTGAEGISLEHSGILKFINQWVKNSKHPKDRVLINSPNVYEKTQYRNINIADNHFLQLSGHYYTEVPPISTTSTRFGFFVGRHTIERDCIAQDIIHNYQSHFITSVMKTAYTISPWSEIVQNVPSIDDMSIRDQYQGLIDTNLSLLQFYKQFQIEIVAETMTAGVTFFPTEKTFRPITGRRPFLVFGSVHFLNNLRGLGFRTYGECWDESYDQYQGPDRWNRIRYVIDDIICNGYDIELATEIADYNRAHLTKWHKLTKPKDMTRAVV